ncbi:MAG: 6-carboxytetrahydropterin synthase QueD [Candidatus Omnitrophota bacterium]
MFEVYVKSNFSAAHRLRGYKGKCEDLHGHNWKVEVFIENENLDDIGMVADFKKIKMVLSKILEQLDHTYINNLSYFKKVNPTSENIAKYIFKQLEAKSKSLKLKKVTVWESETSAASFVKP